MHAVIFYAATIAFMVGIFVRTMAPQFELPSIALLAVLAFTFALVWRRRSFTPSAPLLLVSSVALLAAVFGMVRMEVASWSEIDTELERQVGSEVTLEGVIDQEPDVRANTTHLYVDIGGRHLLIFADRFGEYAYGDRVRITGELAKPEAFETDLGRTFNYPGYLLARDVAYTMFYADIETRAAGEANPLVARLLAAKHAFMDVIELVIPEPQVGLGEGLLLGAKRALGQELEEAFRTTGIIHIVVLSGYNIMLVVAFVMYGLTYVFGIRLRAVFGVAAIVAFAVLVGLSATVVRASIMAGLFLIAKATGQTYVVLRGLLFAGCVMLLLNPYLLVYDTGFQLSFVATLGLIFVAPWFETKLGFMPGTIGAREFLTATLATQVFVLPLLLYQIGEFSVVAVATNLLVLPMVPVAMLLTFLTGLVGFLSPILALPIAYAAHVSLTYILVVAQWFAALPFASFVVPAFPFRLVIVAYAVLGYAVWKYLNRAKQSVSVQRLIGWTIVNEDELLGVTSSRG